MWLLIQPGQSAVWLSKWINIMEQYKQYKQLWLWTILVLQFFVLPAKFHVFLKRLNVSRRSAGRICTSSADSKVTGSQTWRREWRICCCFSWENTHPCRYSTNRHQIHTLQVDTFLLHFRYQPVCHSYEPLRDSWPTAVAEKRTESSVFSLKSRHFTP